MSHAPYAECVNELVCLDLPLGPLVIDRIKQAWDDGDAIFPIDQRLPAAERNRVLAVAQPTIMFNGSDRRVPGAPVEPGDAVVVATSGTTGTPKAVVHTHDAVRASAYATSERLGVTPDDAWLACLPISHVGGLSVVLRSLTTNTRLFTAPQFSVDAYNNAASQGATLVSLVATALQRVDAQLYRTIVLGGSRPPKDLPSNCVTTYGLTETGSGVVYNGSALNGVELKIEDGIIHVRGSMLLRAYRDGHQPLDEHGWFRTGDIGSIENGILSVHGREGDLIITGGENVWPERVEERIAQHPSVIDVCIAGVDDPEWGQAVAAWVVTTDDISLDTLRNFVKETLPAHFAPKHLRIIPQIPRTSLGKPRRAELVESLNR